MSEDRGPRKKGHPSQRISRHGRRPAPRLFVVTMRDVKEAEQLQQSARLHPDAVAFGLSPAVGCPPPEQNVPKLAIFDPKARTLPKYGPGRPGAGFCSLSGARQRRVDKAQPLHPNVHGSARSIRPLRRGRARSSRRRQSHRLPAWPRRAARRACASRRARKSNCACASTSSGAGSMCAARPTSPR